MINKIRYYYWRWYNKQLFKKVNCNYHDITVGADVYKDFILKFPERIKIGKGTSISGHCYINAYGNVTIGESCHIAKGLTIFSHNHNYKSQEKIPYDSTNISKPVIIGDVVWIGSNVSIAPGAKIGNGVIISMGAVIFGEIPDGAIVRGNPAVIVGHRDTELFSKLYSEKAFY